MNEQVIRDGGTAWLQGKRTLWDLMGDEAREVGGFQSVETLYIQTVKFGLEPGKRQKKFEVVIREREMIMGKEERDLSMKRKKEG